MYLEWYKLLGLPWYLTLKEQSTDYAITKAILI